MLLFPRQLPMLLLFLLLSLLLMQLILIMKKIGSLSLLFLLLYFLALSLSFLLLLSLFFFFFFLLSLPPTSCCAESSSKMEHTAQLLRTDGHGSRVLPTHSASRRHRSSKSTTNLKTSFQACSSRIGSKKHTTTSISPLFILSLSLLLSRSLHAWCSQLHGQSVWRDLGLSVFFPRMHTSLHTHILGEEEEEDASRPYTRSTTYTTLYLTVLSMELLL